MGTQPPLNYIVNHVFFPPRLPQSDDSSLENDLALCDLVIRNAQTYASSLAFNGVQQWAPIIRMLVNLQTLYTSDALGKTELQDLMSHLTEGESLIIPIRAQNACVIVRREEATTTYESFEVDPPNQQVMTTKGRLLREFPGPAFEVINGTTSPAFESELVSFLVDLDITKTESAPSTKKAGSKVHEVRDTADPHLIIGLLTAIIHGSPNSKPADIKRIQKRVRNEIMWKSAYAPWRRSPLWLSIRVAIQSTLCRASPEGPVEYKSFMIALLADVILSSDGCGTMSSDVLFCMQNKILRRIEKLSDSASNGLIKRATQAISKAKDIMEARWREIKRRQSLSPPWTPESLNPSQDTAISLLSSKDYILSRVQQHVDPVAPTIFEPSEASRLQDDDLLRPDVVCIALSRDAFVALADIEDFTLGRLNAWVDKHQSDSSACVAIGKSIIHYANTAQSKYKDNPEHQSLMFLTVFLLWTALDRLAIKQHPMLEDYSPEILQSMLDPILLRKSDAIEGLVYLRKYLHDRHNRACRGSIFSDKVSNFSFAIRHFKNSDVLKRVKCSIEAQAQSERDSRRQEFGRLKEKHRTLVKAAQSKGHDHFKDSRSKSSSQNCIKCSLERQASRLKINVHEWPLPKDELSAQAVVFELQCPPAFQSWRTTTYTLLYDMCRPGLSVNKTQPVAQAKLGTYEPLMRYLKEQTRIRYASPTKSFEKSHYRFQRIANAEISSILVNNGLSYSLFDTMRERWATATSFADCTVESLCRFQLQPSSPYHSLEYAMQGTSHSANQPIADQAEVRPDLSVHEHIAFGTLRCGALLQWLNILRELRARTLSFDRFEVHMLFTQTALQVGAIKGRELEWHNLLNEPDFGRTLLSEIDDLLSSVERNWHHIYTLQTLAIIVTRLLACSGKLHEDIVNKACLTLRTTRNIAFLWVVNLTEDLRQSKDEAVSALMRERVCLAAASCRATYDVDPQYFGHLLDSDDDIKTFIQCAIHVQDNTPPGNLSVELEQILARDRRLSQKLAPTIWARIEASRAGLDQSILAIWGDYQVGSDWQRLPSPNDRWLMCTIQNASSVHYNLLDGTLLIDGKPLGRLPSSIVCHPTYVRLLGNKILDVVPSTLSTMQFATRSAIFAPGLFLHFQLPRPDGNLVIQAKVGTKISELVPHTAFGDGTERDFPLSFIMDYAHWLQLSPTSDMIDITFHPLEFKWKQCAENWHLTVAPQSGGLMKRGNSLLVDVRSDTFAMVSQRLAPLEVSSRMHVMLDSGETLSVILPRYKMAFFINDNMAMECSTIRDMVVDFNQSSGTMFGLENQLVLRNKHPRKTRVASPGSRCVVVPCGKVSFEEGRHHSCVKISLDDSAQSAKYFVYEIDTTLGRLTGSTLLSDIYKIYLHACTSFSLPDDLTGSTGTEEALRELDSARYFSFQDLLPEEIATLYDIAALTPSIEWYPPHLEAMQTIYWRSLSPLAQHWAYASKVENILGFHQQLRSIGIGTCAVDKFQGKSDSHLLARLDSRTSGLYVTGRNPTPMPYSDKMYPSSSSSVVSHRLGKSEVANLLAADASAFVHSTNAPLNTVLDLWEQVKIVQLFQNIMPNETYSYDKFISSPLSDIFLPLYEIFRKGSSSAALVFRVAFSLSTIVYASPDNDLIKRLIPTFLSFSRLPQFGCIHPPSPFKFDLDTGLAPDRAIIAELLQRHTLAPPVNQPLRHMNEYDDEYSARREAYWESIRLQQIQDVIHFLIAQWPCMKPDIPDHSRFCVLDLRSSVLEARISELFLGWFNNMNFQQFIGEVQAVLDGAHVASSTPIPSTMVCYQIPSASFVNLKCHRRLPSMLADLCVRSAPLASIPLPPYSFIKTSKELRDPRAVMPEISQLNGLVEQFKLGPRTLHQVYGDALESSLNSYVRGIKFQGYTASSVSLLVLENDYELRRREFDNVYRMITRTLSPASPLELAISQAGQWPAPTLRSLFGLLSKKELVISVPVAWHNAIVALAQSLVKLQRTRRLLLFKISGREDELIKELNNVVDEDSLSFNDPEWLLIQIDGNFTIRPVQSSVAQEMISPRSGRNTLTQLNMGEGKSAVIVPLVSSALADGNRLVRVVTLKPLVNQMFDLLVRRLSGLANRRVFYLPFSRDFEPEKERLKELQALYETCVRERGVLLIQPEHILSFRLMGVDLAGEIRGEVAEALFETHRWLTSVSRDVLDESDEILRATYQLVYTSGLQEPMDSHPDRWTVVQEIMGYTQKHAEMLLDLHPVGLEVLQAGDFGFPIIRILDGEAGEALIDSVVDEVLSSNRFKVLPSHIRLAASDFVRCHRSGAGPLKTLCSYLKDTSTWKHLLLYRGFFGHGLLRFVLQEKRWRVDYGLDLSRTLLAVPYRAKDLPSLRSDFGHPDVTLALTSLSYYYGGLTEDQLDVCLELLFKLDDPPLEYAVSQFIISCQASTNRHVLQRWVLGYPLIPLAFRDIRGINVDDHHQRKSVLGPLLRKNKSVIDFYLSNVVFPRYAKQFPKKLSTSSWDLAEAKFQVTTGFSGTNDNRYLLPTSIEQHNTSAVGEQDSFGQLGTNAKVLSILLRPENNKYCRLVGSDGHNPTGSDFLDLLVKQMPTVRVLLDVGAQMLDMQSTELVSKWLSLVPDLHAVVFFNNADEMVVMTRDQHVEKFVSSQYNRQLDLCAIYLDDAHTRGTDLKLPNDFRAVVTLGPKLTKDRLVQGCMRMRQLGQGQSVIFFAPLEVDRSIRSCHLSPLEPSVEVTSADILRWAMWQTCEQIEHYLPHWAQQGVEYKRRHDAWALHESDPSAPDALEKLRSSWEEPDARTLNEMYEASPNRHIESRHPAFDLTDLRERLDYLGVSHLGDYKTDEEQERQVSQEAELERQRELPPKVKPALSSLHGVVVSLVESGIFEPALKSSPFIPLFSPLVKTTEWSKALFSTKDFAQTIKGGASAGDFLRNVNWILSVPRHEVLVILSPFEANALLSRIWSSKHVHLHIYSPRVNRNMKTLEDLRFFTVPPLPATSDLLAFIPGPMLQLNLWAGQLYLKDFEMYQQLCRALGLIGSEPGASMWDSDGFVKPKDRTGAMKEECKLSVSPVVFLKELFSLRRKGMGYEPTHMGKILNAKPLELKDFELH